LYMNCFLNFSYRVMWFPWTWFLIVISNIKLHVTNKLMECHWCQIFRVCICMSMLAIVLLLLSQILLRLKYNNLYEPKLHLERHIVKLQFVGVFFAINNLPMDVEKSQMLRCIICNIEQHDALFISSKF
jgi:hypothetical protein